MSKTPTTPTMAVGGDAPAPAFVVKGYISGNHRHPQGLAGLPKAGDGFLELKVAFRGFRASQVEAVGVGQRFCPHHAYVAAGLRQGVHGSKPGMEAAIPGVLVHLGRNAQVGSLHPEHRRIPLARHQGGPGSHLVVVAFVDGFPACQVGGGEELEKNLLGVGGKRGKGHLPEPSDLGVLPSDAHVGGGFRQGLRGDLGHHLAPEEDAEDPFGDGSGHGHAVQAPPLEDLFQLLLLALLGHQDHALLAFGEEKLYGAHVPFPGGDAV